MEYTAIEGMTWGEWICSEYYVQSTITNDYGIIDYGPTYDMILSYGGGIPFTEIINSLDEIIPNYYYSADASKFG